MVFIGLNLLGFAGYSEAQDQLDSEPTSETEIICYAAQNQWVCAPADQKQQAHNKAMKLVETKQTSGIDVDNSQVEIKTMDYNNDFDQQVKEVPATNLSQKDVIDEQIKDFVARDEAKPLQDSKSKPSETLAVSMAESAQQDLSEPATPQQITTEAENLSQQPVNNSGLVNDFGYWQNNYAEKWTFQVIGTSNRHQLGSFITTHGLLQSNHSIVKTQANSADWWVVLVGLYDSRDQALSQRDQLPAQLANQAWVRQVKSITGEAD